MAHDLQFANDPFEKQVFRTRVRFNSVQGPMCCEQGCRCRCITCVKENTPHAGRDGRESEGFYAASALRVDIFT